MRERDMMCMEMNPFFHGNTAQVRIEVAFSQPARRGKLAAEK
jgi:hypothetical protein